MNSFSLRKEKSLLIFVLFSSLPKDRGHLKVYSTIFLGLNMRHRNFQWLCKKYTVIKQKRELDSVASQSIALWYCARSRDLRQVFILNNQAVGFRQNKTYVLGPCVTIIVRISLTLLLIAYSLYFCVFFILNKLLYFKNECIKW